MNYITKYSLRNQMLYSKSGEWFVVFNFNFWRRFLRLVVISWSLVSSTATSTASTNLTTSSFITSLLVITSSRLWFLSCNTTWFDIWFFLDFGWSFFFLIFFLFWSLISLVLIQFFRIFLWSWGSYSFFLISWWSVFSWFKFSFSFWFVFISFNLVLNPKSSLSALIITLWFSLVLVVFLSPITLSSISTFLWISSHFSLVNTLRSKAFVSLIKTSVFLDA